MSEEEVITQDTDQETEDAPAPFDLMGHFNAGLEAADADDEEPDVDSPEVSDQDGPAEEDQLDDDEPDADDAGELPTEDETPEPELDDEQDDQEDDEEDADDDPEPEGMDQAVADKIANLEAELAKSRQREQQFLAYLQRQEAEKKAAQAQQARTKPKDSVPTKAMHLALWGGKTEEWNAYSPEVQAKARERATAYLAEQAEFAQDPRKLYEKIREFVLEDFAPVARTVEQQTEAVWAQQVYGKYAKGLEAHADRVSEVYSQLPGSQMQDRKAQEQAFKMACDFVRVELKAGGTSARERKVADSDRQKKTNRRAAKKSRKKRGGKGKGKSSKRPERPRKKPGEDLGAYAERLAKSGYHS